MRAWGERRTLLAGASWVTVLVAASVVLGAVAVHSAKAAVVLAVLLLMGCLAIIDLSLATVVALPACLITLRPTGLVSLADLVLAASTVAALVLYSSREARSLQPLLWLGVAYQASLLPTVVWVRATPSVVEWGHSALLVLGALVTGWVTGRHGRAGGALGSYVVICSVIGAVAAATAVLDFAATGAFAAVYLPGLPKNFLGNSLAVAVVLSLARPEWGGLRARTWNIVLVCCVLGVIAAQSRQALVSCLAGAILVVLTASSDHSRRLRRVVLVGTVPAVVYVAVTLTEQLNSANQFNSANQRLTWFESSLELWHTSPVLGVGLRWWYTDVWPEPFQPPNVILEMLTSAGIVGTIGFLVLVLGALWYLTVSVPPPYRTAAVAVIGSRFVQGQLDLYWVAGTAASLWLVAGIALGAQARDEAAAADEPEPSSPGAPRDRVLWPTPR